MWLERERDYHVSVELRLWRGTCASHALRLSQFSCIFVILCKMMTNQVGTSHALEEGGGGKEGEG